jgi:hypothetical protein
MSVLLISKIPESRTLEKEAGGSLYPIRKPHRIREIDPTIGCPGAAAAVFYAANFSYVLQNGLRNRSTVFF